MNDTMPQGDVKPRAFNGVRSLTHVWKMAPSDIDWAIELGRTHYKGLFDEEAVRRWLLVRMQLDSMAFLRSNHALGIAHMEARYHMPNNMQAYLTLLYAEPGNHGRDVLRVLQALRDWAFAKGAAKFWIGDVTGHDLGPVVNIIGGRLAGHTYVVDLDGRSDTLG